MLDVLENILFNICVG